MKFLPAFIFLIVSAAFGLTACKVQTMNSVAGDNTAYSSTPAGASSDFLAVRTIIRNACISCHSSFPGYSESDWIVAGYVVPGSPSSSVLFQHLKGSGVSGPQDMPQGGQLSSSDIGTIQTWITNISTATQIVSTGPPSAAQRTASALQILQTSCVSCHGTGANGENPTSTVHRNEPLPLFASFTNDNDFVINDLIIPQDSADSWLIQSVSGSGLAGQTGGVMPSGGTPLTSDQITTLRNWIDNIGNP